MTGERPNSVFDRSTGICSVCEREEPLDEKTGLVRFHLYNKKRCDGVDQYPTRLVHDPGLAIMARARISPTTLEKGVTPYHRERQRQRTRSQHPPGEVTVTRVAPKGVDPAIWRKAVRLSARLGGVRIDVCLPKQRRFPK
jgi:hypothetical protein